MKERRRGFTLIELLVVIAIIALLSSVVLASLSTARMKARDSKRISDLRQIAIAISMYADANGNFPETTSTLYNQNTYVYSYDATWNLLAAKLAPYIAQLPKDPINNANSSCQTWSNSPCYAYAYGNVGNGIVAVANLKGITSYDLFTKLETPNHPQSCGKVGYRLMFDRVDWCGSYPKTMYDGSLD